MATVANKFRAVADEMGDWGGLEQEAAECWNDHVAPALLALYDRTEADGGDADGIAGSVQSLAWDAFCDTTDDESWDELGIRVSTFVLNQ